MYHYYHSPTPAPLGTAAMRTVTCLNSKRIHLQETSNLCQSSSLKALKLRYNLFFIIAKPKCTNVGEDLVEFWPHILF